MCSEVSFARILQQSLARTPPDPTDDDPVETMARPRHTHRIARTLLVPNCYVMVVTSLPIRDSSLRVLHTFTEGDEPRRGGHHEQSEAADRSGRPGHLGWNLWQ
jgi:hypothetical protein